MHKIIKSVFFAFMIFISCICLTNAQSQTEQDQAVLNNVDYQVKTVENQDVHTLNITAHGLSGFIKDKDINFQQNVTSNVDEKIYKPGDKVYISVTPQTNGQTVYGITDFVRSENQIFLFVLFLIVLLIIGGFKGIRSVIGLLLSLLIIIFFIIPNILNGADALLISITGAGAILVPTIYFVHGFNKKSSVAIIGALISLLIAAALAILFTQTGKITGVGNDDALYLFLGGNSKIKAQSLFLAGIIIGTLGVLIDMTVGQSSAISEINDANPHLTFKELYYSCMNVGKDHIGSLVNTLFLAYAGASLPLLISFTKASEGLQFTLSMESTAMEILRAFIGSIALILAVPITTLIGVYLLKRGGRITEADNSHQLSRSYHKKDLS